MATVQLMRTTVGKRIRPNQPRVIKRRPKEYPLMTKPREEHVMG